MGSMLLEMSDQNTDGRMPDGGARDAGASRAGGRATGGFRNEFSWSHSRQGTFRECRRRYYYQYYGYWGGWAPDADPFVRKLYVLRNLKNRYLWTGSLVHDAVAGMLEHVRAGYPPPDADEVAEQAVARMRSEFRQSRDQAYLEDPKRCVGLTEHHYREPVADAVWRDFAEMVRRSIHGFARGPYLNAATQLSREDWLTLEQLLSFEIDGAKVYVKMDLAHRRPDGGAVILDWKTGRRRPQPEGLQLGCYAIYAAEAWAVEPERIQVIEANINTGAVGSAHITPAHLHEAREAIRASIAEMRACLADVDHNVAELESFPADPSLRLCGRCVFREVCPEFAELQASGARPGSRREATDQGVVRG